MPGWYFAHAQDDLNAQFLHVLRHFFTARSMYNRLYIWYSNQAKHSDREA